MRVYIIFSIFTILTLFFVNVSTARDKPHYSLKDSRSLFNNFKRKFKRNYANIYQEEERFKVFKDNLQRINYANENPNVRVYQVIGPFSDMNPKEFVKYQDSLRNKPGSLDYGWRRTDKEKEKEKEKDNNKMFKGW